jgi:hypothetical protein
LWLQAGEYPARLDRHFIEEIMRGQNRVFRGLVVSSRAGGANFSVDVSAGTAVILGNSENFQGAYFVRSTAVYNIGSDPLNPLPPTPAASRLDTVIAVVNDPQAGGEAGDNWALRVIEGTTIPQNSIALATIARSSTEPSILPGAITDIAPRGEWAWTVGTSAPTGRGIPGDLYIVC